MTCSAYISTRAWTTENNGMPLTLDSLPREIIQQLVQILDLEDAAKLRYLSRSIKEAVDASSEWKKEVDTLWLSRYNQKNESTKNITNYATYYCERRNIDRDVNKTLDRIVELGSSEEVFKECWRLVEKKDLITPELERIRNRPENHYKFSLRYFATELLRSIYRSTAYEAIDIAVRAGKSSYKKVFKTYEEFLFKVSHFDPSFHELAYFRNIYVDIIHKELRNNPVFENSKPAEKVAIIFKTVYEILHDPEEPLIQRTSLEDNCLIRLYAKKSNGHPITNIAVVEKIATDLNINVQIMQHKYFENDNFPLYILQVEEGNKYKYVWLSLPNLIEDDSDFPDYSNFMIKNLVFRYATEYQLYHEFRLIEHVKEKKLSNILKPMELQNQVSIYVQNYILALRKLNIDEDEDYEDDEDDEELDELDPKPDTGYSEISYCALYDYYHLVKDKGKRFDSEKYHGKKKEKLIKQHISKGFPSALTKHFPWDLPLIQNQKIFQEITLNEFENIVINDFFNFEKTMGIKWKIPDSLEKELGYGIQPGDLCYDKACNDYNGSYGVVLGYRYFVSKYKPNFVYRVNVDGSIIDSAGRIITNETAQPSLNDKHIQDSSIGLYFKNFNIKTKKFIPTPFLENTGSTTERVSRALFNFRPDYLDHNCVEYREYDAGLFGESTYVYEISVQYDPEDSSQDVREHTEVDPEVLMRLVQSYHVTQGPEYSMNEVIHFLSHFGHLIGENDDPYTVFVQHNEMLDEIEAEMVARRQVDDSDDDNNISNEDNGFEETNVDDATQQIQDAVRIMEGFGYDSDEIAEMLRNAEFH